VEHEFAVSRAAQATGLPAPATEAMVEVEGRHGIVFERLAGPSMLQAIQAKPWTLLAAARQLGELHAQIHSCATPPDMPTQRRQIENGIDAAKDLPEASRQAVRRFLDRLPDGEAFCHGDFHPDNILLTARGPVIIDWMTATRGHPLADVARTALLFQTGGLPPGVPLPARLLLNASRAILYSAYLKRYLQLRPAARQEIDAWQLPLMVARLREVENYPQEKRLIEGRIEAALKAQAE
jgi:aminoglycoside phosphotransferase (APT) family kinase protein